MPTLLQSSLVSILVTSQGWYASSKLAIRLGLAVMATVIKRGDSYRAVIRRQGNRTVTKTFKTKSDALAWARKIESEIERGIWLDIQDAQRITVYNVIDRYENEILIKQKSYAVYIHHLKPIKKALGHLLLSNLKPSDIAKYRDNRLSAVQPSTVTKEISLLSRILDVCMKEFSINLPFGNVVSQIRMSKVSNARDRILTEDEEIRLIDALSESNDVQDIVRLALETAMRRSELVSIEWTHIDFKNRTLHIPITKTDTARTIPLSSLALRILKDRKDRIFAKGVVSIAKASYLAVDFADKVFDITPHAVTVCFTRACKRAGITGLHFHDIRHSAITRFFELGLNVMEVSSISGHQDLRMLKRYTHLDAKTLVKQLDAALGHKIG